MNRNNLSEDILDLIYRYIVSHYKRNLGCKLTNCVYERDSQNKLHLHGIIMAPEGVLYKHLNVEGVMVYKKPIDNLAGWMKYCNKAVYKVLETRHFNIRTRDEINTLQSIETYISSAPPTRCSERSGA